MSSSNMRTRKSTPLTSSTQARYALSWNLRLLVQKKMLTEQVEEDESTHPETALGTALWWSVGLQCKAPGLACHPLNLNVPYMLKASFQSVELQSEAKQEFVHWACALKRFWNQYPPFSFPLLVT